MSGMDQLVVTVILAVVVLPRVLGGAYDLAARLLALLFRCGPVARLAALREDIAQKTALVGKLRAEVNELETRAGAAFCAFCASEVPDDTPRCDSCGRLNAAFLGWRS